MPHEPQLAGCVVSVQASVSGHGTSFPGQFSQLPLAEQIWFDAQSNAVLQTQTPCSQALVAQSVLDVQEAQNPDLQRFVGQSPSTPHGVPASTPASWSVPASGRVPASDGGPASRGMLASADSHSPRGHPASFSPQVPCGTHCNAEAQYSYPGTQAQYPSLVHRTLPDEQVPPLQY